MKYQSTNATGCKPQTFRVMTLASLLLVANAAFAAEKTCISLANEAQVEQEFVEANGQKAKRLVPPGKVLPGGEITYTITAKNTCVTAAERVVIDNPVPQHMAYVMGSALGVGTDITFSVDGKTYEKPDALKVTGADGKTRRAGAADIKSVRWAYANPVAPGSTGLVRFRATVK
jgi:uncharacterized repeat protein (TIGR01451 family)